MAKIPSYTALLASALAVADQFILDHGGSTRNMTVTEMNKYWATVQSVATLQEGYTFFEGPTPSATASGETWLNTVDGYVYKSTGTGTGNWVFQYVDQLGLVDIDQGGSQILRSKTIQDIQPFQYAHFNGSSSSGVILDNINIDLGANDFTILGWFRTSKTTAGVLQICSKRSGAGNGYQVYHNSSDGLTFIADDGTQVGISSDGVINNGEWHSYVIDGDASENLTMYIDAIAQADVKAHPVGDLSNAENLYIGSDAGAGEFFDGDLSKPIILNKRLTAAQIKGFGSNPNIAPDWADEGGSNVAQNVSTCVNLDYTSFANGTATGFDATSNGGGIHKGGTVDEIAIVVGKKYRVSFDLVLNSGTAPSANLRASLGGASKTVAGAQLSTAGANSLEFTASTTDTVVAEFRNTSTATDFEVTNLDIHQLGATLELKPQDMSPIQALDSANGLICSFTDVELGNISLSHIYPNKYPAIADNDTFVVPEGCAFLELSVNPTTPEAATTIRVGTTDGGQEVVADSPATATANMKPLTMLLNGFSAGDTLYIGSDGGAAWTTLVADIHVRYQIIKV